ncbi:AMP-binding protein [Brevibacterium ihuae]|uniref:AMP-binding protein n=1 Tax=Brevibacterium ihuae TaxID=1631743 RepID=UPI00248300AA|nr:AMP-binding protein [Brevibacterium ihuae]
MIEASRVHGDADMLVYGDERLSYAEHFRRVAGLARGLVDTYGIAPGDRVAIAMRNYPEWSIAFFAAACAGAVVVPLNAWWAAGELEFGLRDSGSSVLLADEERFERLASRLPELDIPVLVARPSGAVPAGVRDMADVPAADALPDVEIGPEDGATIFYTSGTTGTPKGAFGTHRNICGNVMSVRYSAAREQLRQGASLAELLANPHPRERSSWPCRSSTPPAATPSSSGRSARVRLSSSCTGGIPGSPSSSSSASA